MRWRDGALALFAVAVAAAALLFIVGAASAQSQSCSPKQALRELRVAHRAVLRAERREKEARHVYKATVIYSVHNYDDFAMRHIEDPAKVGRWVRLARKAGWEWGNIDTLMHVVARESSGSASVENGEGSGATGLLQLMPGWYAGDYYDFPDFDPHDPYLNLYYGHKGWLVSGWSPWAL